jgi:hypothetical protein
MYKIGDTFIADFHTWTITKIDEEGVSLEWDKYLISVSPLDKAVFVYRKFKNGNTRGIWWNFSFEEIKMVNKIVEVMYV